MTRGSSRAMPALRLRLKDGEEIPVVRLQERTAARTEQPVLLDSVPTDGPDIRPSAPAAHRSVVVNKAIPDFREKRAQRETDSSDREYLYAMRTAQGEIQEQQDDGNDPAARSRPKNRQHHERHAAPAQHFDPRFSRRKRDC